MTRLQDTLSRIEPQSREWRAQAEAHLERLTMPHWALGRLMDLALDLAGMRRSLKPVVTRKTIIVMAGDHGVEAEGVSKYPQVVTVQMVHNFVAGGAGINALARLAGAEVVVVDMGVAGDLSALVGRGEILSRRIAPGTANIARGPAMTREQAVAAVEAGIDVVLERAEKTDVLGTGDMGIANTTPSSAIVAALTGRPVAEVVGRGTGLDEAGLAHKVRVVEQALRENRPDPKDGLDVLSKVGGFEIGGIAGMVLGAAAARKPIVVDGFISTAGALIAHTLCPSCAEYVVPAHRSAEAGHRIAWTKLNKRPLLDLDLRLGEGTGAALAMHLVEAAVRVLTEVATFEEAHVAGAKE